MGWQAQVCDWEPADLRTRCLDLVVVAGHVRVGAAGDVLGEVHEQVEAGIEQFTDHLVPVLSRIPTGREASLDHPVRAVGGSE